MRVWRGGWCAVWLFLGGTLTLRKEGMQHAFSKRIEWGRMIFWQRSGVQRWGARTPKGAWGGTGGGRGGRGRPHFSHTVQQWPQSTAAEGRAGRGRRSGRRAGERGSARQRWPQPLRCRSAAVVLRCHAPSFVDPFSCLAPHALTHSGRGVLGHEVSGPDLHDQLAVNLSSIHIPLRGQDLYLRTHTRAAGARGRASVRRAGRRRWGAGRAPGRRMHASAARGPRLPIWRRALARPAPARQLSCCPGSPTRTHTHTHARTRPPTCERQLMSRRLRSSMRRVTRWRSCWLCLS